MAEQLDSSLSSLSLSDSASQNEDWDRSLTLSDVESSVNLSAEQNSTFTPRNSVLFPVDKNTTPDRTRTNVVQSPTREGKRSLSELLKLHAEKGTDVTFSPEEAARVADVLGQWINASSSPYEGEDDFFARSHDDLSIPTKKNPSAEVRQRGQIFMATRNPFTRREREHLVKYIALNNPEPKGRSGHALYIALCDNHRKYPWSRTHTWQSWRDHYVKRHAEYDKLINQFLQQQRLKSEGEEEPEGGNEEDNKVLQRRALFTAEEDKLLVEYLATHHPRVEGRSGSNVFLALHANKTCEWAKARTAESWRAHYSKNRARFDEEIKKYQIKYHDRADSDEDKDAKTTDEKSSDKEAAEKPAASTKRKREDEVDGKRVRMKHTQFSDTERTTIAQKSPKSPNKSPVRKRQADVKGKGKAIQAESEEDMLEDHDEESNKDISEDVQDEDMVDALDVPARTPAESPKTTIENLSLPSPVRNSPRKPAVSPESLRRIVEVGAQAVASSSKIQLSPSHPRLQPQPQTRRSPRRPKAIVKDDVFYATASPPSPPHPSDAAQSKHKLPKLAKLANGHFGTRFVGRQKLAVNGIASSSEDEKEAKAWPPRRKKDKGKGKAVEVLQNPEPVRNIQTVDSIPPPAQNMDDVVHIKAEPTQSPLVPQAQPSDKQKDPARPKGTQDANPTAVQPQFLRRPFESGHNLIGSSAAEEKGVSDMGPPAKLQNTGRMRGQEPTELAKLRNSWAPGNALTSDGESDTRARRHSSSNMGDSTSRRIDLRTEVAKRRIARSPPRTHSRAGSIAPTASHQPSPQSSNVGVASSSKTESAATRRSFSIADDEREHIEFLGLNTAIQNIAERFGYTVEQAWLVYDEYKSIKRTEQYFQIYRTKSANIQAETYKAMEQMMQSEMDTLDLDERPIGTPNTSAHLKRDKSADSSTASTRRSLVEPQLKIKPLPANANFSPSKYSPPQDSRAGQWNRLVGQGRAEEAMSREHRRASGNGRVFPALSLVRGESNGSRRDVESVAEQLLDATDVNAEEAEEEGLNTEEEKLFLSAHAGVAEELRAIEQRIAPDVMLRWVAARFKELDAKHRPSSSSPAGI
ncbi:hypothetical protein H0H92_005625 [Tricholoma furcatifolium]|nr:hypothetical protein H0H92_005625 [Tricholoma furcatifolium]